MKTSSTIYRNRAKKYAADVLSGKIPACKHTQSACKRFQSDLKRKDIVLTEKAEVWCRFIEKLPHVKGVWAAKQQTITLSGWQVFITVNLYGWYWKKSGTRRFREGYIEVPRKNGKSLLVACFGIGHLTIDGEFGAEIYTGATTEKQAWEVFRPAKLICEREHDLRAKYGIEANAKTITILKNGSRFEPVIGKPGDGSSPSCAIVDEFHEHESSELVDTFHTGMGAREQPMLLQITTAGSDMGGPCYAKRSDVIKILGGTVHDDAVFGIIFGLDDEDEWDTIEAQKKANPNYGISVNSEFLKGQLEQARRSATKQSAYKTKHLNMWIGAKSAWMNMLAYQACRRNIKMESFKDRLCFVGLDLASKIDIASMAIVFPPDGKNSKWAIFTKHYLPEDTVLDNGNTRYQAWHADGWITATPGNVTDYDYIKSDLDDMKSLYEIKEVAFDPFQVLHFANQMVNDGFPMVEYGQTVRNFSQPMKELEALIVKKSVEFTKDPVLLWMFGNVVARLDKKDNIFPDKDRVENKIDGVVAIIMALARALRHMGEGDSVYEKKELLIL